MVELSEDIEINLQKCEMDGLPYILGELSDWEVWVEKETNIITVLLSYADTVIFMPLQCRIDDCDDRTQINNIINIDSYTYTDITIYERICIKMGIGSNDITRQTELLCHDRNDVFYYCTVLLSNTKACEF